MRKIVLGLILGMLWPALAGAVDVPRSWERAWPRTDFSRHAVDLTEIISGGPPKDGIPSIDDPAFVPVAEEDRLAPQEPVIGLVVKGEARAYPLRILHWHEIVNDVIAGVPVAVTYCPLCNAAVVFDRRVDGQTLEFGTTGKLRHSDLVMYDRQTESWWQQFLGEAIVGEMTGTRLTVLPARLESWAQFKERAPHGKVLVPNNPRARPYGRNPYVGYDRSERPFLYRGDLPAAVPAMMRVVVVEGEAWTLPLLREKGTVETGDGVTLTWMAGQASALDARQVAEGRDVGTVVVQRDGEDIPYDLVFAFVFFAFHPEGTLHTQEGTLNGGG